MIQSRLTYQHSEDDFSSPGTASWQAGIYETSATFTAVANALMGKKSKAEYLKKPLLESAEEERRKQEGILSEEEKKKQRNALLASLQLMQANFELNHEKGSQDE